MIPKVIYRGVNVVCRANSLLSPNNMYVFEASNGFTLQPDSFEDLYYLLQVPDIVLAADPKAKDVQGRPGNKAEVAKARAQQEKTIRIAREAEISDNIARKKKYYTEKFQEKMQSFGHAIAEGLALSYPEDAGVQAEEYANKETGKKYGATGSLLKPVMRMFPGII